MIFLVRIALLLSITYLPFLVSPDIGTNESECFVVESDTTFKCYRFINDKLNDHCAAQGYCLNSGGRMAIVESNEAWRRIIDKFLNKWGKDIWVGLKVPRGKTIFDHPANLSKSDHWFENRLSQKYSWANDDRCIVANSSHHWDWYLTGACTEKLAYLCEYNVTNCNMSEVNIPNADFQKCHTSLLTHLYYTIEVKCWNGFNLIGSKDIKCHLGKWIKPFPKCIPGCRRPGKGDHALLLLSKEYYDVGERVAYVCDENYVSWKDYRKTHFIITCEFDGQWSEDHFYCVSLNDSVITIIDINEVKSRVITLKCSLENTENVQWMLNGRVIENDSVFSIFNDSNSLEILLSDNVTGIYHCQENKESNFLIGNTSYHVISRQKCASQEDSDNIEDVELKEGENILLRCNHTCDFGQETWFKDNMKIIDNYHHKTIPRIGLYLKNVTTFDEGIYKCDVTCRQNPDQQFCKRVITHRLSVLPSTKTACGLTNQRNRQPWLVVLSDETENSPFCYGTILNKNWIISSGFCLSAFRRKKTITGVYVHLEPNNLTIKYPVSSIKIHPMYRARANQHDIGLIQLRDSLPKFSDDIRPICISGIDFSFKYPCERTDQINGITVGWGTLLVDNTTHATMQFEKMTVVAGDVCKKLSGHSDDIVCVNVTDAKDNFAADVGSPFIVDYENRKYLMGVYSWGERAKGVGNYDYFTMVFVYYDWILNLIKL